VFVANQQETRSMNRDAQFGPPFETENKKFQLYAPLLQSNNRAKMNEDWRCVDFNCYECK